MRLVFPDLTYEKLGGAENMICAIVKSAYINHGIRSVLIGSSKSFILKRLAEDQVPYEFIETASINEIVTYTDDLFVHFHNYDGFHQLKNLSGKSVLWGILAPQITEWNRFGIEVKLTKRKVIGDFFTKKLIKSLWQRNALISMDGATANAINCFLGRELTFPILPIPIDTKDARSVHDSFNSTSDEFRISYIGRSDDLWKIKPVKKFIHDLKKIKDKKFKINIYTDCAEPYLKELSLDENENISVEFYFGFYGKALRDHISSNSNLHFSMGTAALEGALSGIATILIDPCLDDFPDSYRYKWLFETDRNSLGRFIGKNEIYFSGMSIDEVVEICSDKNILREYAERSLDYVIQNHSVDIIVDRLISHQTQAGNRDICRWTPATWPIVKNLLKLLH